MPDRHCSVVENRDLGNGVWLLRLRGSDIVAGMQPGCFVMLSCGAELLLRRPFSIQRVDGDIYDILYRVVGLGTAALSQLRVGQEVQALGPLGNSFTWPGESETAVLLGGGVGIPPMVALADALTERGHGSWEAYVGVGSAADVGCFVGFDERYGADPRVRRATMDGSIGFHGHVVAAWMSHLEQASAAGNPLRVYACGPMVMLRAVQSQAAERGLPCEVSVETMMGCGMGACMSCVIENSQAQDPEARAAMSPYDRWLLACRRGPVFEASSVVLEEGEFLH